MIYAKLSDAPLYRGIHPRLDRALDFLTEDFLAAVGTETRKLEGEDLYVTRFDVASSIDEARLFEYHQSYLDIFCLVRGEERVDIAAPEALALREQHGDYWGGTAAADQSVILRPGSFLVLFPGDAHRPGMAVSTPQGVSRVVFKIRIKEN
ncbi:MAG: YhcH/YjgK/YiaL family protein [Clostridia bacterium]|nr:YhcH/YjgK/YiaL family protein [Bacteroidales bacterium]MBO5569668.1 YhcH/YjgK/YiaL family protein [Clostridia bacterium]